MTYHSTQHCHGGEISSQPVSGMGRGFNASLSVPQRNNSNQFFRYFIVSTEMRLVLPSCYAAKGAISISKSDRDYADSDAEHWNNNYWFYMFPVMAQQNSDPKRQPSSSGAKHNSHQVFASGATSVTVEFTPDAAGSKGTKQKMQAQLYIVTAMTNQFMVLFSLVDKALFRSRMVQE